MLTNIERPDTEAGGGGEAARKLQGHRRVFVRQGTTWVSDVHAMQKLGIYCIGQFALLTLKRETIIACAPLPILMKVQTPAQHRNQHLTTTAKQALTLHYRYDLQI